MQTKTAQTRMVFLCLCGFVGSGFSNADSPGAETHTDAWRSACHELVTSYAFYRDRTDADAVANLFTENARFTLNGQVFEGRAAIRQRIAAGRDGPVFRHMMSTVHLVQESAGTARGVSYVTVYAGAGKPPITNASFLALGEYHDRFVRTPAGWRISEREFVAVFTPPTGNGGS